MLVIVFFFPFELIMLSFRILGEILAFLFPVKEVAFFFYTLFHVPVVYHILPGDYQLERHPCNTGYKLKVTCCEEHEWSSSVMGNE